MLKLLSEQQRQQQSSASLKASSSASGYKQGPKPPEHSASQALLADTLSQIQSMAASIGMDSKKVQLLRPIGQGGCGTVYVGVWQGMMVAVKTVLFSGLIHGMAQQADSQQPGEGGGEGGTRGKGSQSKAKATGPRTMPRDYAVMEAAVCTSVSHPNVVSASNPGASVLVARGDPLLCWWLTGRCVSVV